MKNENYVQSVLNYNKFTRESFPKSTLLAPYEPARSNLFVVSENSLNIDKQYISEISDIDVLVGPDYYNYSTKLIELTILDSIEFLNYKNILTYIMDIKQDKTFKFKVDLLDLTSQVMLSMKIDSRIYSVHISSLAWSSSNICNLKMKCHITNVELI